MVLMILSIVLLIFELKKNKTDEYSNGFALKDDIRNMTKTLIIYSIGFTLLIVPRSIFILLYSSTEKSFLFTLVKVFDFLYSIYLNSSFFVLILKNDLFLDEFRNSLLRHYSIENGN